MKKEKLFVTKWAFIFCCFIFLTNSFSLFAQETDTLYTFLHELPENAKSFTTDQLRQCYLITNKNEVIKYDANGKELFRFNNNTLGNLAHIDATDPFNILLYYPDYLTIILLDRTLTKTGEYSLYDFDIIEGYSVGISNDNNIWIYDDREFKIKKINREGEILAKSDDLSMILGIGLQPNFILERHNNIYVNDPAIGILQFDVFGTYVKTIPLKNLSEFQILNKQLVYQLEHEVLAFHLQSLVTQKIPLPKSVSAKDKIRMQKDRLYILQNDQLKLYSF